MPPGPGFALLKAKVDAFEGETHERYEGCRTRLD